MTTRLFLRRTAWLALGCLALGCLALVGGCGEKPGPPITALEVHSLDTTLGKGRTLDVHAAVLRSNGAREAVTGAEWVVEPAGLASWKERDDGSGVVTLFGLSTGTLEVRATYEGFTSDPLEIIVVDAAWTTRIVYETGGKLGGCDVGDLDPSSPGNEIAAVGGDGRVFLVHYAEGTWSGRPIAQLPGEMIQCAIGDADPTRPGNELVVVGMAAGTESDGGPGAVHLIYRSGGDWATESVFEDTALVHGVAIGEVDPEHDGNEIVVTGFAPSVTLLGKDAARWVVRGSVPLEAAGKNVLILERRLLVANTGRSLVGLEASEGAEPKWNTERVALGAGQARLGRGAKDVVVACDDGSLRLATQDGPFTIHQENQKLRGAVLGDLDPSAEGEEAATVGYGKAMTILYRGARRREPWTPVTLWRDTEKLHHLAVGELVASGDGLELVAVGYSGRVLVAARTSR